MVEIFDLNANAPVVFLAIPRDLNSDVDVFAKRVSRHQLITGNKDECLS